MGRLRLLWDLYSLKRNTVYSERKIAELQDRKMRHILKYAYEHSAFYHRTFEEAGITEENLESLPFHKFPSIDKDTLMEHFDELVTVNGLRQEEIVRFDEEQKLSRKVYQGKYHVVHSSGRRTRMLLKCWQKNIWIGYVFSSACREDYFRSAYRQKASDCQAGGEGGIW